MAREDHRRVDNGAQVRGVVAVAMASKPSVDFCGIGRGARLNRRAEKRPRGRQPFRARKGVTRGLQSKSRRWRLQNLPV
jgi:hypothetical protein